MEQLTSPVNPGDELRLLISRTKARLLCNIVLNSIIRTLPRFLKLEEESLAANALVTIILAALLYLLFILIGFLFDHSIPFWNPAGILVSLLTALSLSIVKGLHDEILPPADEKNFAKKLIGYADTNDLSKVSEWWRSFLSLERQLVFAGLIGVIGVLTLRYFAVQTSLDIHYGSYLLVLFCGIAIGQGGYCAITIPRLSKALRDVPMRMFWLHPADTVWVKEASSVFTKLSLANAFIATCIMAGLSWPKPWKTSTTTILAAIWLVITLSIVLYSFFYPQYHLSKIIRAEKSLQMSKLQKAIRFQKTVEAPADGDAFRNVDEGDIKRLNELIKVYDQLVNSRESAIDMQALLRLFFSLVVPILSFIGIAIQLGSTLAKQLKDIPQR